jgi:ornithine cyclodeaminase/alanine dehydrogenase-like protein (mu-crystallin family)
MKDALRLVEQSFRAQNAETAVNRSRERIVLPHFSLHYMAAALVEENLVGMKIYTVARDGLRFLVLLYDASTGELRALMEADQLGRIRTGAASGVATKYLARPEAARVGILGIGRQARTQLEAVAAVRKISSAAAYGRNPERRSAFCRELSEKLKLEVCEAASAEDAVRDADIVITATTSAEPVLRGDWLRKGAHVNAIGANMANRREVDGETIKRASLIAVDSLEQSRKESGDLIVGLPEVDRPWEDVIELHQVVAGKHSGRTSSEAITIFKSNGIALWDLAVAAHIERQARAQGLGRQWDMLAT